MCAAARGPDARRCRPLTPSRARAHPGRKCVRYIRLADFQVSNTLVTLVSDSAMLLYKSVTPAERPPNVVRVKGDEDAHVVPVKGVAVLKPLFEVAVLFDGGGVLQVEPKIDECVARGTQAGGKRRRMSARRCPSAELSFAPSRTSFNHSLNLIIMEAIQMVSMEPLLQHADLASFVQAAMEESQESAEELDFAKRIRDDEFVLDTVAKIFKGMAAAFDEVGQYIEIFAPYRDT